MQLLPVRGRPLLRRAVFWGSLGIMLTAAPVGMVWALVTRDWGAGPVAALALGMGALCVAVVFGLIEFTSPIFHPESHLFSWDDVDELRQLARSSEDAAQREWARSLADRIAVVLPGRSTPPESTLSRPPVSRKR